MSGPGVAGPGGPRPILRAGETCWRIERATRAAVLVDNAAYFAAARSALLNARRSVLLVGWIFDPRTSLTPGGRSGEGTEQIGALLNTLAAERPDLRIRLLIWEPPDLLATTRDGFPQRTADWLSPRIRLHLDKAHPLGAAHHQKMLIIDGVLAFCSGADFMSNRWDTPAHLDEDPRRRRPSGEIHQPRHDVTALIEGDAARALAEVAAERWRLATGETVEVSDPPWADVSPWPADVTPLLTDHPVAVARTQPAINAGPEIRENERLWLACVRSAREHLYIETQYFVSADVGEAIEVRLREPRGPEVILVCSPHSPSFFDRAVIDPARDVLVRRLQAADRYGRLRILGPHTSGGQPIVVHSKLATVDERLLRIGSSNLDNRSMGFDTECDVALEAGDEVQEASVGPAIRGVRSRLIAHFLGCSEERLEAAQATCGSLTAAIEACDDPAQRRLRPLRPGPPSPFGRVVAWLHLGDPRGASDAWRPWRRRHGSGRPSAPLLFSGAVAAAGALYLAKALFNRRPRPGP